MKKYLLVVLGVMALFFSNACCMPIYAESITFDFGGQTYGMDIPEGFKLLQEKNDSQTYNVVLAALPPTQKMLAVLSKNEPLKSANRVVMIHIAADKSTESLTIPSQAFENIGEQFLKRFEMLLSDRSTNQKTNTYIDQRDAAIDKVYGANIDFESMDMASLGSFRSASNAWTAVVYQKMKIQTNLGTMDYKQVLTMSRLLLKGKILALSISSAYVDQNDITFIQEYTRGIIKNLNILNAEAMESEKAAL